MEKYIIIHEFMTHDLKLKGNELLIYAIIYNFTNKYGKFSGSLQYLANKINSTKQGVLKNLKNLNSKNYVTKHTVCENKIKRCYYTTLFTSSKQSLTGRSTEFNESGKQSLPKNKIENKYNILYLGKQSLPPPSYDLNEWENYIQNFNPLETLEDKEGE